MAAKFDKELLKKHHFWFLFIPVLIFLFVAWFGLLEEVPEMIAKVEKEHKDKKTSLANAKAKSKMALDEYDKQLHELDVNRARMWKEGWAEQKDLFNWPAGYADSQRRIFANLEFGNDSFDNQTTIRQQFRADGVYANEYKKLVKDVEPIQFRDRWERTLRYKEYWGKDPSPEDMWLAMEDFWIQRELLMAIHKVNVLASQFKQVKGEPDQPLHRKFKSRMWEIDLQVVTTKDNKQMIKGTMKNVSGRLLVMGVGNIMKLKVMLSGEPFILEAEGEPVEADKTIEIATIDKSKHTIKKGRVTEIESVEQILDARTVPIKRIEYVALGKLSDRNNNLPLDMAAFSKNAAEKDKTAPAPAPVGLPIPVEGAVDDPQPVVPGLVKDAKLSPLSPNGFPRNRYIVVTKQIRRFPFGIVVTTDQSFMKDIMEQLLTIRLRMQMTQVSWTRFHDTLDYTDPTDPLQKRNAPNNNRDDQFSANLMELSVYGILTLYEQPPQSAAAPKTTTPKPTTPKPTTPKPTTPPTKK